MYGREENLAAERNNATRYGACAPLAAMAATLSRGRPGADEGEKQPTLEEKYAPRFRSLFMSPTASQSHYQHDFALIGTCRAFSNTRCKIELIVPYAGCVSATTSRVRSKRGEHRNNWSRSHAEGRIRKRRHGTQRHAVSQPNEVIRSRDPPLRKPHANADTPAAPVSAFIRPHSGDALDQCDHDSHYDRSGFKIYEISDLQLIRFPSFLLIAAIRRSRSNTIAIRASAAPAMALHAMWFVSSMVGLSYLRLRHVAAQKNASDQATSVGEIRRRCAFD